MNRTLALALAAGLILSAGPAALALADCGPPVQKAQTTAKDVSQKVIKMKRLHQARKMMSKKEAAELDRELKALSAAVKQASALCKRKKDKAAIAKADQAMTLAKALDARHVALMKASMASPAGHETGKGEAGGMKMGSSMNMKQ